jgi:hypothetical protein
MVEASENVCAKKADARHADELGESGGSEAPDSSCRR